MRPTWNTCSNQPSTGVPTGRGGGEGEGGIGDTYRHHPPPTTTHHTQPNTTKHNQTNKKNNKNEKKTRKNEKTTENGKSCRKTTKASETNDDHRRPIRPSARYPREYPPAHST